MRAAAEALLLPVDEALSVLEVGDDGLLSGGDMGRLVWLLAPRQLAPKEKHVGKAYRK